MVDKGSGRDMDIKRIQPTLATIDRTKYYQKNCAGPGWVHVEILMGSQNSYRNLLPRKRIF